MFKRLVKIVSRRHGEMGDSEDKDALIASLRREVDHLKVELQQAEKDELTGLPGRRSYNREIERMLNEVQRSGFIRRVRYGLLVVDLDGFKPINDNISHVAGDQLLQKIALSLRGRDFVARYGGDEFVVIARVKGKKELMLLANRLSKLVRESEIVFQGQTLSTTASIGGTLVTKEDDHLTAFLRADEAMYASKAAKNPEGACHFIE